MYIGCSRNNKFAQKFQTSIVNQFSCLINSALDTGVETLTLQDAAQFYTLQLILFSSSCDLLFNWVRSSPPSQTTLKKPMKMFKPLINESALKFYKISVYF